METVLAIISINLLAGLITEHLLWLHALREEEVGEYYNHPFLELAWDEPADWLLNLASIPILCAIGVFSAIFSLACIINHFDTFTVYVECSPNTELKKNSKWRFWRWGVYKLHGIAR